MLWRTQFNSTGNHAILNRRRFESPFLIVFMALGFFMLNHAFGIAVSVIATFTSFTAFAQTFDAYECTFRMLGGQGEETQLLFVIDGSGKAFTYDILPGSETSVRVPVNTRNDGPNHVIYSYAFNHVRKDTDTMRLDMQVRIPRAGGASRMSVTGRGYSGGSRGAGTCTLRQNVRLQE
jgi:hypothetical protein